MRIIAGEWRGRPLEAPPGAATRPTADRVRETLFSMLASRLGSFGDLKVADLFAGSGALGFEALSRGAASATFVESNSAATAVIRKNAANNDNGRPSVSSRCVLRYHHSVADDACGRSCTLRSIGPGAG